MARIQMLKDYKWHLVLFGVAIALAIVFICTVPPPHGQTLGVQAVAFPAVFILPPEALLADAAVVYDPADGRILYEKNAEMPLPLASLTKLMSADVVLAHENPSTTVLISSDHVMEINDSGDVGLRAGANWSIGELVRYGLFASSNNAMLAAASAATGGTSTIAAMNAHARELGLNAQFYNPTGLDITAQLSGGYGSARDVAIIAADFYRNEPLYFESTMGSEALFGPDEEQVEAKATSAPIADIPGVIAAKTGYTDLARGNMAVVFDATLGHPLIAVVLHSTEEGRFGDIRTLIAAARTTK